MRRHIDQRVQVFAVGDGIVPAPRDDHFRHADVLALPFDRAARIVFQIGKGGFNADGSVIVAVNVDQRRKDIRIFVERVGADSRQPPPVIERDGRVRRAKVDPQAHEPPPI